MFTLLLMFGAAWFGFKKAKLAGRNPYLWGLICIAAFVVPQVVSGILMGSVVFLASEVLGLGQPLSSGDNYFSLINILSLIAGFIGLLWAYRYLDRVPIPETVDQPPPPPPTFTGAG